MLYSVMVELTPEGDDVIAPTQGRNAHALFLNLITAADRSLGDRLHEPGPKPFTVSPLMGRFTPERGGLRVHGGTSYRLRFTLLDDAPFAGLLAGLMACSTRPVHLGSTAFRVTQVHTLPTSSPLASATTFDALLAAAPASAHVTLEFLSPTAFSFGDARSVVFPEPRLVFGSLLSKWNLLAPTKLSPSLSQALDKNLLVSRFRLETRTLDFGKYKKTGFVGECSFEAVGSEPGFGRAVNALAAFAFYAGVGYKTTMGMGQTRFVPERSPKPAPPAAEALDDDQTPAVAK